MCPLRRCYALTILDAVLRVCEALLSLFQDAAELQRLENAAHGTREVLRTSLVQATRPGLFLAEYVTQRSQVQGD